MENRTNQLSPISNSNYSYEKQCTTQNSMNSLPIQQSSFYDFPSQSHKNSFDFVPLNQVQNYPYVQNPQVYLQYQQEQLQQQISLNNFLYQQANAQFQMMQKCMQVLNKQKPRAKKIQKKKKDKQRTLGSVTFKLARGDWICPRKTCSNWNYSKRQKCNMCGISKKEKNPSNLNKELPVINSNEPDWTCSKCSHINFSHKEQCYKCSQKKPEQEQLCLFMSIFSPLFFQGRKFFFIFFYKLFKKISMFYPLMVMRCNVC